MTWRMKLAGRHPGRAGQPPGQWPRPPALGAAYAAGLATGFWRDTGELRANWHESKRWSPSWTDEQRAGGYAGWRKAVQRPLHWVDVSLVSSG